MRLLRKRLKVLLSCIMMLSILLTDNSFFVSVVDAAVPDTCRASLNVGDILEGGVSYSLPADYNPSFMGKDGYVQFGLNNKVLVPATKACGAGSSGDLGTIKLKDINGSISDELVTYIIDPSDSDNKLYYKVLNYNEYYEGGTTVFLELEYIASEKEKVVGDLDGDGIDDEYFNYDASYDPEPTTGSPKMLYLAPNSGGVGSGGDFYYGYHFFYLTTPEVNDPDFIGWQYVESYYDTVYFVPVYEDSEFIRVKCHTKYNFITDDYNVTKSWFVDVGSDDINLTFRPLNLTDGEFIGWDKDVSTLNVFNDNIDLYAQYGKYTKITEQPTDVSVSDIETATYNVTAEGENLGYTWYIGDQVTQETSELSMGMNLFEYENGCYTSINKYEDDYASLESEPFFASKDMTLSFDYKLISEYQSNKLDVTIYKLNEASSSNYLSWKVFNSFEQEGQIVMDDYQTKSFNLPAGNVYRVCIWHENSWEVNEGYGLSIKNLVTTSSVLSGNVFSTDEDPSINASSEYFKDDMYVQCEVTGTYGTVRSNVAKLDVTEVQKTLVGISAQYNGEVIKVGNHYNKNDVIVTGTYRIDSTGEEYTARITDFTVDDTEVKVVGANPYVATHGGMTADFTVPGGDVPSAVRNLKAGNVTATTSDLTWETPESDGGSPILGYNVYLQGESTPISVTELLYNCINLVPKTDYTVEVSAFNIFGEGPKTEVTFTTLRDSILTAEYKGSDIYVGKDYSKDNVEVKVLYDSGAEKVLKSDEWSADSLTVTSVSANSFTASWDGITANYTVKGYKEDHIEAVYNGLPVDVGTNYDKSKVQVVVFYTNGSTRVLETDSWTESSLLVSKEGANTFTATYKGLTADYIVNGKSQVTAVSINSVYTGDDVEVGTNYNKSDVEVTVYYSDDTSRKLATNEFTVDSLLVSKVGVNIYTASYQGLTDDFNVNGINKVKSIKAKYKGVNIKVGNEYSKSDVEVTATYSDGSEGIIPPNEFNVNSLKVTKKGINNYTASYKGLTSSYTVVGYDDEVVPKYLTAVYNGVNIKVGNDYSKSDVQVTVVYSDNTTKVLDSSEWTESGLTVKVVGKNTFTATYKNLITTYDVIGVDIKELKAEYKGKSIKIGNNYKKKDVTVTLVYTDDTTKVLSDNEWKESSLKVTKVGANKFTATYNNFKADYKITGKKELVGITAKYTGSAIEVGKSYSKDDVKVKLKYHDGYTETLKSDEWDESSLLVKKVGVNKYTATYEGFEADYTIIGKVTPTKTPDIPDIPSKPKQIIHTGVEDNFKTIITLLLSGLSCSILLYGIFKSKKDTED